MYAKLVFRNAKRSVKDYLIYIVTMTICVTLFYSFLSVSSQYYQPDIGSEYNFTILSDGMKAAICMITRCLLFLIRFVNSYMLRRRQKEFAVQSILGMEQRTYPHSVVSNMCFRASTLWGYVVRNRAYDNKSYTLGQSFSTTSGVNLRIIALANSIAASTSAAAA